MEIIWAVACMGSISYYLVIVWYTGKWNSTFSLFWPTCGIGCGCMAVCYPVLPIWGKQAVWVLAAAVLLLFLIVEGQIIHAFLQRKDTDVDYLIVLGAQVRGKTVTDSLRRRLDKATDYLILHPHTSVIVSGGQGKGESVTEARAMRRYLCGRGIARERILLEENSSDTWENLRFSARLMKDIKCPAAVVTNNFHIYRALLLGAELGFHELRGIAADCNPVLFANYMMREFFAVLSLKIMKRV